MIDVTFKDLQKAIQSQSQSVDQSNLSKLRNKPFWILDPSKHRSKDNATHGACCFNHIIGLPKKDGKRKPLFDYENHLYRALLDPS